MMTKGALILVSGRHVGVGKGILSDRNDRPKALLQNMLESPSEPHAPTSITMNLYLLSISPSRAMVFL